MSRRKIAEQILRHEKPGKVAFSCGGGIMWGCVKNGLTTADLVNMPDAGAKFLVDMFRDMKSDFMFVGSCVGFIPHTAMGGEANYDLAAPELIKKPLESVEDIDKYDVDEVIKSMRNDPMYHKMLEQVRNAKELVQGDEILCVGPSAPFTAAGQLLGVEQLMEALFDDEDGYVEKIMRFWNKIAVAYTKDMLDAGGEMVYMWDPVASGDLISPAMYEEFVVPALSDLVKELHAVCPYIAMHICGDSSTRPGYIAQMGIDGFSVGDIDVVKASNDANGQIVMMGNLNPATTLINKSADEIYEISMGLCKSMANSGGFILSPGCDLSPLIPFENLQVMAKAVDDYNASLN